MKQSKADSKPSAISEEYVIDSGEEEDAASEPAASPSPSPQKASLKRKRSSTTSVSKTSKSKVVEAVIAPESDGPEGSDDQDEESQSDAEQSQRGNNPSASATVPKPKATKSKKSTASIAIPAKLFKAPDGFVAQTSSDEKRDKRTDSLLSNLKGKGLWHITAPASVPLTEIKQFPLYAIASGEKVLQINGNDYAFRTEVLMPDNQRRLLLLDRRKNIYKASSHVFSQTLHVQQIVAPPQAFEQSEEQLNQAVADAASMPYPQPKGMKMRYRPFGTEPAPPETIGSSSSDESDEGAPTFRIPPGSETAKKLEAKSRKKDKLNGGPMKSPQKGGRGVVMTPKKASKPNHPTVEISTPDSSAEESVQAESSGSPMGQEAVVDTEESPDKTKKKSRETGGLEGNIHEQEDGSTKKKKKKKKQLDEGNEPVETETVSPEKAPRKGKGKKRSKEAVL